MCIHGRERGFRFIVYPDFSWDGALAISLLRFICADRISLANKLDNYCPFSFGCTRGPEIFFVSFLGHVNISPLAKSLTKKEVENRSDPTCCRLSDSVES